MSEKILQEARERFKTASDAWAEQRKLALEDLKFAEGEQWPDDIVRSRDTENRPCLTINRTKQFVKQITNEQRQNRPAVKVSPVDDKSDVDTAEVFEGIIRHIETSSDADVAYDTSFDYAAKSGLGYFRVLTDYVDDQSFEQEAKIARVTDPFSVYFDPRCSKADFSDAKYCFIVEDLSVEEYKAEYPNSELAGLTEFSGVGNEAGDWISEDEIRVAEYFYVETKNRTFVQLASGQMGFKDELIPEEPSDEEFEAMDPEIQARFSVVREREVEQKTIKWCKHNAIEILEKQVWPGKWIPVIPVVGDEIFIQGKRRTSGIVRDSKDAQRMYNYWASAETEQIALAPKSPWIGAVGQFEGHEAKWNQANTKNWSFLEYNPISVDGVVAPPPQRNSIEPAIQAVTLARRQAADDLKAVTGIYDASLGARSNETSGRAIVARQREGDTATFNFPDNMKRSIRHLGRILVDLIPKIYDVERIARIIGADEQEKQVQLENNPEAPAKREIQGENGKIETIYNVGVGRYDVTVSSGPDFSTKREEAVESMTLLTQAYPDLMSIAGDLLVKNMDWPGADEVSERLKKTLPPNILEDEDGVEIPPQVKAQMQSLMQQHQQLTEQLQQLLRERETEQLKLQHEEKMKMLEMQSKERLQSMKTRIDLMKTQEQLQSKENVEMLKAEISKIGDRLEQMSFGEPV